MIRSKALRHTLPLIALIGLGGCASLQHFAHWAPVRPIAVAKSDLAPQDGYYASAKAAIGRRDYGAALELLQAARAVKPNDVRVLNAFGVVYDKLGRFDLSDRYYAQAKGLDPTSAILANNQAYSAALQTRTTSQQPIETAPQLALAPPPFQSTQVALSRPAIVRLALATPMSAPIVNLGLTGRPLVVADASGGRALAEPIRQQLVRLGWSAPRLSAASGEAAPRTTIDYPTHSLSVAQALARTLPPGVQLVDCGSACQSIRLTIGADAAGWTRGVRPASTSKGSQT